MVVRAPLVVGSDGELQELQPGDKLPNTAVNEAILPLFYGGFIVERQVAPFFTPAAGYVAIVVDDVTGNVLAIDSTGATVNLSATGGGGSLTVYTVEVDFGSLGEHSKTFDLSLAGAVAGQKVIASPSLVMPSGVDEDELEMDMIAVAGRVISNNNVRIVAASVGGRVTGRRNINIVLG